jgi:hypothetical protein
MVVAGLLHDNWDDHLAWDTVGVDDEEDEDQDDDTVEQLLA